MGSISWKFDTAYKLVDKNPFVMSLKDRKKYLRRTFSLMASIILATILAFNVETIIRFRLNH